MKGQKQTKPAQRALCLGLAALLTRVALIFAPMAARVDVSGAAGPVGLPSIAIGIRTASNPTVISFGGSNGW